MCNRYPSKLASFLHAANPDADEEDDDAERTNSEDTVHLHIKKFQVSSSSYKTFQGKKQKQKKNFRLAISNPWHTF